MINEILISEKMCEEQSRKKVKKIKDDGKRICSSRIFINIQNNGLSDLNQTFFFSSSFSPSSSSFLFPPLLLLPLLLFLLLPLHLLLRLSFLLFLLPLHLFCFLLFFFFVFSLLLLLFMRTRKHNSVHV